MCGNVFDTTLISKEPFKFNVGESAVIKAFNESIKKMSKG